MYPLEARTAMGAAFIRAAHRQVGHPPLVFDDYLAEALLEPDEGLQLMEYFSHQFSNWSKQPIFEAMVRGFDGDPFLGYMRTSPLVPEVLARQAFAEGLLRDPNAYRQYLILGAGLDTFAFRNPDAELEVYEVDREEVSRFKRSRASSLRNVVGRTPVYVPMTIDWDELVERLLSAGLKRDAPTLVSCLGLTPYLGVGSLQEMFSAVRRILSEGSVVVYDYTLPDALSPEGGCPFTIELAERLQRLGEPLNLALNQRGYESLLARSGYGVLEHLAPADIQARYFIGRRDGLSAASHVCMAAATAV
ncbi:MAG: S-adenosyl-L-methionine-dependent methyltransferase [Acidimicrobiia bacterium]